MMGADVKKNEQGQALIEMIVFLPLLFTVYAVISGFANAINGSINQQKVTRGYFYFRLQNNSQITKPDFPQKAFMNYKQFGMSFLGWKEYFEGNDEPIAPCYKVSIPLKSSTNDTCANKYTTPNTMYMRVGTAYGMCGATYSNPSGSEDLIISIPDASGINYTSLISKGSCETQ